MATPDEALRFDVHDNPSAEYVHVVDTGLGEANKLAAPIDGVKPLGCFVRSEAGAVIGGAVGRTWGECCELQQLWVASEYRQRGVGSRLVRMFESRGRERGCRTFYLDTFSFQALAFYRSLGYRPAHEIGGFPDGIVKYLMVRNVASDES